MSNYCTHFWLPVAMHFSTDFYPVRCSFFISWS